MAVQLLNSKERCVDEALEGLAASNPGYYLVPNKRILIERDRIVEGSHHKLALVSGGGSGHEPALPGFVGRGMFAAVAAGSIFASPASSLVLEAISAVGINNPNGVLVIIFNYTGDRINLGLAVERSRRAGIKTEIYISGDDCALTKLEGTAGRRGLCGTFFIIKIAGAMAEAGASLEEALASCRRLGDSMGTIGVAVSGCTLPGATTPLFTVPEGTLELGLGVHGEAGAKSIKSGSAREIVKSLLDHMTLKGSETRLDLQAGDEVAVMVNNLGSVSQLEMLVLTREVVLQLTNMGVKPLRVYQGSFMTSLDMKGFHLSILRLLDPTWTSLLDAPTSAPGWPRSCVPVQDPAMTTVNVPTLSKEMPGKTQDDEFTLKQESERMLFRKALASVTKMVPKYEDMLNRLDTGCGDGDCGSTLIQGIAALEKLLPTLPYDRPGTVLSKLSDIAMSEMGGTSGGLYSILLMSAANVMSCPQTLTHLDIWTKALKAGTEAVIKYGGARKGDRTMLDTLLPVIDALESSKTGQDTCTILRALSMAADTGAKATQHMKAKAGRASYVRDANVTGEDAGARAVALIFQAMAE